jgi:hypothetical protein
VLLSLAGSGAVYLPQPELLIYLLTLERAG